MASDHLKQFHFKPGQTGNPNGRPKIPKEIQSLRRLTRASLELVINRYVHLSYDDLRAQRQNGSLEVIDMAIVSILCKGIETGDQAKVDYVIARLVGKIPEAPPLPPPEKDAGIIDARLQKALANIKQMAKDNLDEEPVT